MELGNLLFGYSFGQFEFKNRDLVKCEEWQNLLKICKCDSYGYTKDINHETKTHGYENDLFVISPYQWEDYEDLIYLPNFLYKKTGFEIKWYKYPFRDSYMNQDLSDKEIKKIWQDCINYVKRNK